MKEIDNFINSFDVLKKADFQMAENDEIYRMGIIIQFNLTLELAWKAIKAVLEQDGVGGRCDRFGEGYSETCISGWPYK